MPATSAGRTGVTEPVPVQRTSPGASHAVRAGCSVSTEVLVLPIRPLRRLLGEPVTASIPVYREMHVREGIIYLELDDANQIEEARLFLHRSHLVHGALVGPDMTWVAEATA